MPLPPHPYPPHPSDPPTGAEEPEGQIEPEEMEPATTDPNSGSNVESGRETGNDGVTPGPMTFTGHLPMQRDSSWWSVDPDSVALSAGFTGLGSLTGFARSPILRFPALYFLCLGSAENLVYNVPRLLDPEFMEDKDRALTAQLRTGLGLVQFGIGMRISVTAPYMLHESWFTWPPNKMLQNLKELPKKIVPQAALGWHVARWGSITAVYAALTNMCYPRTQDL